MSLVPNSVYSSPNTPVWALSGSGRGPNLLVSTLAVNPTGALTFPASFISTLNISSINGATPGTGGTVNPNLALSTLKVSSFISSPTINLSSIQASAGPLSFTNIGAIQVDADIDMTIASVNINITSAAAINAPNSDLSISSIGGGAFVSGTSSITMAQLISSVKGQG